MPAPARLIPRLTPPLATAFAWLLAALVAAAPALAQPGFAQQGVTVSVEAPPRVLVGEPAQLGIVIRGARSAPAPSIPPIPGLDIAYSAPMQSMMSVNGRTSVSITHLYALTARKPGTYTLPALDIVIDGRTYSIPPTTIEAAEAPEGAGFTLALAAERSTAFVGQPVRVRLIWTLGKNVNGDVRVDLPIDGAEADVLPGPDSVPARRNEPGAIVLTLNGVETPVRFDGRSVILDQIVIPRKSGRITVGPARIDFGAVVGMRNDDPFDRLMGGRAVVERQRSTAPAITLDARDLPAAGRPDDFSGLVGQYALASSIDAPNVNVGDPINLTVRVNGPYPISLVPPLDLSRQPALAGKFRVPREPILPEQGTATASFRAMIRARSADVTEVGPIRLNYFDPDKGEYAVATAPAIPLKVTGAASVKLPDLPDEPAPAAAPDPRTAIDTAPLELGARPFDLGTTLRSPVTLSLLAAPPAATLALAGLSLLARRAPRDPAARRRRRALRTLSRELARAGRLHDDAALAHLAHALSDFSADLFDRPNSVVAGAEAAERFRSTGLEPGARLADVLDACDAARFGPLGPRPRPSELIAQARTHAAALARARPSPPASAAEPAKEAA
jgi:hypothetical protein